VKRVAGGRGLTFSAHKPGCHFRARPPAHNATVTNKHGKLAELAPINLSCDFHLACERVLVLTWCVQAY